MDRQRTKTENEPDDHWISLIEASVAFIDTDVVYGPTTDRTRAAKHRLAAALEEFTAYQDDLRRWSTPFIRRIK